MSKRVKLAILFSLVLCVAVAAVWCFVRYSSRHVDTKSAEVANCKAIEDAYADYLAMGSIVEIIDLYENKYATLLDECISRTDKTQLAHIKAGYEVAKVLDGLNARRHKHSSNELNDAAIRSATIGNIKMVDTGREDLQCIVKIVGGPTPVTAAVRNKNFQSNSIKRWLEFCEKCESSDVSRIVGR